MCTDDKYKSPSHLTFGHVFTKKFWERCNIIQTFKKSAMIGGFKYFCNGCKHKIHLKPNYCMWRQKRCENLKPNQIYDSRIKSVCLGQNNGNISGMHRSLLHPLATVRHRMWAGPETNKTKHNKNKMARFATVRITEHCKHINKYSQQIRTNMKTVTYLRCSYSSASWWCVFL